MLQEDRQKCGVQGQAHTGEAPGKHKPQEARGPCGDMGSRLASTARWVAWGKAEGAHGHCPSATTAPPHGTPPSRACQGSKAVSTFHQQDRNRISLCGTPTPHWLHAGPHNKHRRAVVFPTRKLMWFFWSGSLKYYKSCDSPPIPWWRLLDSSTLRGTNVAPVKASVWGLLQSQGIFHPPPLFFSSL